MGEEEDGESDSSKPLLQNDSVIEIRDEYDMDVDARVPSRLSPFGRDSKRFERKESNASRRTSSLPHQESDVAFTIVVKREQGEEDGAAEPQEPGQYEVDIMQETVQEAVQDAVTEAVQEAVNECVQDAVQEAVQEAVQQAIEDSVKFDVRANFYTLIAITGVILYWRGVWTTWDYIFGLDWHSGVASLALGLLIIVIVRLTGVPLVESLPGG